MPALIETPRPEVRVAGSAPLELMWLVHFLAAGHPHTDDFAALEPQRQRWGPRLIQLWDDGMPQLGTELVVLADRTGTMLDLDLDRFFARLDGAAAERRPLPSLRSESAEEREAVRGRLERLAVDPAARASYVELMRDVWRSAGTSWPAEGKAGVLSEVHSWTRAVAEGAGYLQVLRLAQLWSGRPELDALASAAAAQGRLTVTPCWFGGKVHVVELDGAVYAGRGIRYDDTSYRKIAAEISTSIKALADPTRLAILLRLARHPASVTEVARQFELSQPTVSAHVQILRDAGLLEERSVGRSAQLSASEEGLRRLFSSAEESLIRLYRS